MTPLTKPYLSLFTIGVIAGMLLMLVASCTSSKVYDKGNITYSVDKKYTYWVNNQTGVAGRMKTKSNSQPRSKAAQ